jgi:NADH-ubiquinone oxidoreductase chain 5
MSSLAAILEKDFKKIIALSTLSHLGFIVVLVGFNNPDSAFFHLVIHAFFKALLFITVGVIIHNSRGYQRFNIITSIFNLTKLNSIILTLSIFRLCGLPFLSGFYSKDLGLEQTFPLNSNALLLIIVFSVSLASAVYSTRILKNILLSSKKNLPINWVGNDQYYEKRIVALLISSIIAGEYFQIKIFLGVNFFFLSTFIKIIIPLGLLYLASLS